MLRIQSASIELVRLVAPIATCIERHDRDLASQLRRSLSSVPLNVAEGSDQIGRRRASHYSIALGSAREAWAALSTAAAWGYIAPPDAALKKRFDEVIGTLVRVLH